MITSSSSERGGVVATIVIVGLSVFMVAFGGLAVWAYVNYMDQKNNVDAKISKAVATAEKVQADDLEKKFEIRDKEPNRSFAGPSDYGTLGFKYPKTWSVYVSNDGASAKSFQAYLNPATVPSVESETSRYALRVSIVNESYEDSIAEFQDLVEEGQLKASPVKVKDQNGTRLDGSFSKDIRGAAVIYKIRDKTAIIRTDADTFKPDFENIIKTITFIQ
jgi:hypothetical protein